MRPTHPIPWLLCLALVAFGQVRADTLKLKDGTVLTCQKVGTSGTKLAFKVDGKLRWFNLADVAEVVAEAPTPAPKTKTPASKEGPASPPTVGPKAAPSEASELAGGFEDLTLRLLTARKVVAAFRALLATSRDGGLTVTVRSASGLEAKVPIHKAEVIVGTDEGERVVARHGQRAVTLGETVHKLCSVRCYPLWRLAAAGPLAPAASGRLAKAIARLSAHLDKEHVINAEDAAAMYHAADALVRAVLQGLAEADRAAVAWPGSALSATVGERAWPPPKGFDAAALRERAKAEANKIVRLYRHENERLDWMYHQISFSRDGRLMASSENEYSAVQRVITLWEVESRRCIARLSTRRGANSASFSPDGSHIVVAGERGPTALFNTANGAEVRTLDPDAPEPHPGTGLTSGRRYIAWSPCGIEMAASAISGRGIGTGIGFFHDPECVLPTGGENEWAGARFQAYSADGYTVAFAPLFNQRGRRALCWLGPLPPPALPLPAGKGGHVQRVAFSDDGSTLACLLKLEDKTSRVAVWDWPSVKLRKTLDIPAAALNDVHDVAFAISPDGNYALYHRAGRPIEMWDVAAGKVIRQFSGGGTRDGTYGFVVHPSGMYLGVRYLRAVILWGTGLAPVVDKAGRVALEDAAPGQVDAPEMPDWLYRNRGDYRDPREATSAPFELPPRSR